MMLAWWQRLLLIIVCISAGGTVVELLLLEHIEDWQQLIPITLLGLVLVTALTLLVAPVRWAVTFFRGVLVLSLVSAALGMYFHYQANVEFVLERHPRLTGWPLFTSAMTGAMPALAPGTMAQIALIGWLATFPRRSA
jgi:hypothetical protein